MRRNAGSNDVRQELSGSRGDRLQSSSREHPMNARPRLRRLELRGATALAAFLVALGITGLGPGAALAAAPTLLSAGQTNHHLKATWSLAPDTDAWFLEVGTSRQTTRRGDFRDFIRFIGVNSQQTSWRSGNAFDPGTYFIHVSSKPTDRINAPLEWSNILKVEVPGPTGPTPGRYSGRTSQHKPIQFKVSDNGKRIKRFAARVRVRCQLAGGGHRKISGVERVRSIRLQGKRFRKKVRATHRGVRENTLIKGRFDGKKFRGMIRVRLSGPGGSCDSGRVRWKARRKG
jgi:hypothetical protein